MQKEVFKKVLRSMPQNVTSESNPEYKTINKLK